MKKVIMAAIAVASLCLSNAASAADVVITTGQQGLTYNAVYGVNLASALSEYGYSSTVIPSKGSLDNLDCTKTLVVANTDAGDDMLETASTVLLKNLSRVLGTNGK